MSKFVDNYYCYYHCWWFWMCQSHMRKTLLQRSMSPSNTVGIPQFRTFFTKLTLTKINDNGNTQSHGAIDNNFMFEHFNQVGNIVIMKCYLKQYYNMLKRRYVCYHCSKSGLMFNKLSSQQQKVKDYKEKCINIKLFIHINKMNLIEAVKFKN